MLIALFTALVAASLLLGLAGLLQVVPGMGRRGRALGYALCEPPLLDLLITMFTIAPPVVGAVVAGAAGLVGGVIGQVAALLIWNVLHEWAHPDARRGPRIVKTVNALVGRWRNHTAIWLTALVVPLFWMVRVVQLTIYPLIVRLVGLPEYDSRKWVTVSRHKFDGLVGHDLIWCLYCDWMTGVWSLGSEMLRNVESFWCPIRFSTPEKCERCRIDFPDVADGWVDAGATMSDVTAVHEQRYHRHRPKAWFGHPVRLTHNGEETDADAGVDTSAGVGAGAGPERGP